MDRIGLLPYHVLLQPATAVTVSNGLHNGGSRIALRLRNGETFIKTMKAFRIHLYTAIRMKEDKSEVVGRSLFASPNSCRWSTVARVWEGALAGHSNTHFMRPVAWPASVARRLCLCRARIIHMT